MLSTFAHVISFPFWLFGGFILLCVIFNQITMHRGKRKDKATVIERLFIGGMSLILLIIAYFLTSL